MNIVITSSNTWFTLERDVATSHNVTYIHDNADLTQDNLTAIDPDVIFFPHWNWKVSSSIHTQYPCIVFHTAPLPYGRGGSPIQNLILEGYAEAPVCAIQMTDDIDAGAIYLKQNVSLKGSLSDIFERINSTVNILIAELVTGVLPEPKPQTGEPYYFKRRDVINNIIPKNMDLEKVFDRIRMLDHRDYPQSYIIHGNYKIEFSSAEYDGDNITATCKISKC